MEDKKVLSGWKKWLARGLVGTLVLGAGYQVANSKSRDNIEDYVRDLHEKNRIEKEERGRDYDRVEVPEGMKVTRKGLEEKIREEDVEEEVDDGRGDNNYNPPEDYNISSEGLDLIKEFEGFREEAYKCPAGVWTIGYGHTEDVDKGDTITREGAEELLIEEVKEYEESVKNNVEVDITQEQYDALVSFTYNLGGGSLEGSTLLEELNSGNYSGAAKEFDEWVYSNGKKLEGLVKRREKEKELYESSYNKN